MVCHQRKIRDDLMASDPRPVRQTLDGCGVIPITRAQAESVILTYEWLGTMPKVGRAYYGLVCDDELHGVACFGEGMGTNAKNLCGEANASKAIALERGACVHYAHPHAASFLIANACKQAAEDHGWRIFYAYSDAEAGEIGTVYQACNWLYIGTGVGRGKGATWRYNYFDPTGEQYTSRRWRAHKSRVGLIWEAAEAAGWTRVRHMDKGRYLNFYGGDKRECAALRKSLKYTTLPYPKR